MKKRSIFLRGLAFCMAALLFLPLSTAAAELEAAAQEKAGSINLLLVGRDADADTPARSDTIILCTLQPESGAVTMTSFLRDLYLPIPGYGSNRLNAAYAFGGTALLRQTLLEQFEVEVDGCVEVDFSSFPQIIDLLGGVELELRQDEADVINKAVPGSLAEGMQLLNGQQALAYSRIRKLDLDGDISRSQRQRKLITSLVNSYRSASLLTILSTVADLLPMLSTDLSKREILLLAAKLFPLMDDPTVSSLRIPADGTFSCQRIDGMEVLVADLKENRKILMNTLSQQKDSDQ